MASQAAVQIGRTEKNQPIKFQTNQKWIMLQKERNLEQYNEPGAVRLQKNLGSGLRP